MWGTRPLVYNNSNKNLMTEIFIGSLFPPKRTAWTGSKSYRTPASRPQIPIFFYFRASVEKQLFTSFCWLLRPTVWPNEKTSCSRQISSAVLETVSPPPLPGLPREIFESTPLPVPYTRTTHIGRRLNTVPVGTLLPWYGFRRSVTPSKRGILRAYRRRYQPFVEWLSNATTFNYDNESLSELHVRGLRTYTRAGESFKTRFFGYSITSMQCERTRVL